MPMFGVQSVESQVEVASGPDGYRFTSRGLVVSRPLSNAEFERVGRRIGQIANATNWTVGDWLLYGQDKNLAGAKYERAQEITGMSYAVLAQALKVASSYELEERVTGASWTHHRAALPLPTGERVLVLERAVREQWTVEMLLVFVNERHRAMSVGLPLESVPSPSRVRPLAFRGGLGWRKNTVRRPKVRTCPKCGHRWVVGTTAKE
jgi:hypothetical protein